MEEVAPEADLIWRVQPSSAHRGDGRSSPNRAAVRPGGCSAARSWRPHLGVRPEISSSHDDGRAPFDGFEIERFEEEEKDGEACSGPKHWHLFHVLARRPA
jgi:hypothetical protein